MSDSIKLSEKHGVNPSICKCFFCGKPKGVALLGKINKQDDEAPREICIDYEPCDECQANMDLGITLIGVETTPIMDHQPPIQRTPTHDFYPTGSWCVISEEAARRCLLINEPEPMQTAVMTVKRMLVPQDILQTLMEQAEQTDETN